MHAVTMGDIPSLERFQVYPNGKCRVRNRLMKLEGRTHRTVSLSRPHWDFNVDPVVGPSSCPVHKRLALLNAIQNRSHLHPAGSGGWRFLLAPPSFTDPPRNAFHTSLNVRILFPCGDSKITFRKGPLRRTDSNQYEIYPLIRVTNHL